MTAWQELGLRLVAEYQAGLRLASAYQTATRRYLVLFVRYLTEQRLKGWDRLTTTLLVEFQTALQRGWPGTTPRATSTVSGYMNAVHTLCLRLYREELTRTMIGSELLRLPRPTQDRPVPTKAEVAAFLEAIDTTRSTGLRNRVLFEIIYSSGLRASEAAGLQIEDIDQGQQLVRVRGKYGKERLVPLSGVAWELLLHYLGHRASDAGPVFPRRSNPARSIRSSEVSHVFRREATAHDTDYLWTTHGLRHATATHLLENGAGVRFVQELLGHASLESTVRYTRKLYETLGAVYRKCHPRGLAGTARFDPDYRMQVIKLGETCQELNESLD